MLVMKANKTKMVRLMKEHGYKPTVKGARFQKLGAPGRSFILSWLQPDGMYQAYLTAVGGKPYCTVKHDDVTSQIKICTADLTRLDMTAVKE